MRAHNGPRVANSRNAGAGGLRDPNKHPNIEAILCLPTAPNCQTLGNGSPFFRQLFRQRQQGACLYHQYARRSWIAIAIEKLALARGYGGEWHRRGLSSPSIFSTVLPITLGS
jgi:hypothetical protein